MFITKVKYFREYCEILFPWLEKCLDYCEEKKLCKNYNMRLPAFLAERFTSFWFSQKEKKTYLSYARLGSFFLSNNTNRLLNPTKFLLRLECIQRTNINMSFSKITIVITTFKSELVVEKCLESIPSEVQILIVENSNNIIFKNELEQKYKNVNCILAGDNLGYAKGNNLGISKVKTQYALILNPDAVLASDALDNFLQTASHFPDFAIIGPAKQEEYSLVDLNKEKPEVFSVKSLKGFAMFLNLEQFQEIGFFDENFFIYLEEIDLCKRLEDKNKKIYLNKKIIIHHTGGSSHNEKVNF